MNYATESSTTGEENGLLENLIKKNAQGIAEMRRDTMPVMVPVQEKDWDTIVNLLQAAVEFQPEVYKLMEQLLTVSRMRSMMDQWSVKEQEHYRTTLKEMTDRLNAQQTAVENLLLQMKNIEQQAGSRLEEIMSGTLESGRELERAIANASEKTGRGKWLIRTAITVGASALAAVLSTLLCVLWLV